MPTASARSFHQSQPGPPQVLPEYLLTMPLSGLLLDRLQQERSAFAQQYQYATPTRETGIWLVHFWQWTSLEKRFIAYFREIAARQPALLLEINGFGFLPSHSIILHISNASAVANLVKAFRPMQRMLKSLSNKPHFITEPYLLFASKLKPWQYEKSLPAYQYKSFTGRCVVQQLELWKKESPQQAFRQIARFPLQSAPAAVQHSLFD
jgi:hypothetical protein